MKTSDATRLFQNQRGQLLALAYQMLGELSAAEDIVQEAYVRAHKTQSRLRETSSEKSWLFSIALNAVRDHYRASARAPAWSGAASTCSDTAASAVPDR